MSTVEKMTVHKALAELKIIDSRIERAIEDAQFCVANKHSNEKINGIPVEDAKKLMIGSYDKASDLIKRRNAIKRAVVLSNAKTIVAIADREYTVAEAIEMKNHGIEFEEMLLREMRCQYADANRIISTENGESLSERADKFVIDMYGSKEGKTITAGFEKVKKDFITANSYDLVDPLDIKKKIDELEDYISNFKTEVDAALSVSNAITEISVEY